MSTLQADQNIFYIQANRMDEPRIIPAQAIEFDPDNKVFDFELDICKMSEVPK